MNEHEARNSWARLKRFTQARIALGRSGNSLPTSEVLAFGVAHAQARDAVHLPMKTEAIAAMLGDAGFATICVDSAAPDRDTYLRQPDLGRQLDQPSRQRLSEHVAEPGQLVLVVADGLSAIASERHALPLLKLLRAQLVGWTLSPIVLARQARVAIGDEIGEVLRAEVVVILIGERPGLSSPDSLGIYLTYRPRVGRTDAERNCISNVRPHGLSYESAVDKLCHLLAGARRLQASGVMLHDESDEPEALPDGRPRNITLL